jgi:hypothetical protein
VVNESFIVRSSKDAITGNVKDVRQSKHHFVFEADQNVSKISPNDCYYDKTVYVCCKKLLFI